MSLFDKMIDKRIAAYQGDLLPTHYAEVENMYRQMRGWRHDYRNHIQVLKSYADMGAIDDIKRYLDALDTDLNTVDMALKTGNKMTDVILNSKISLAKSKEIAVTADAHVAVALTTAEIDLCIIIGNLFDNAIEASMALPVEERMIRVYMDMKNTQLYMSFTNRTAVRRRHRAAASRQRSCCHSDTIRPPGQTIRPRIVCLGIFCAKIWADRV